MTLKQHPFQKRMAYMSEVELNEYFGMKVE